MPPVRALAAVVMDASNGAVMAAVNPHLHLPMASTTKVMTALLALQMGHLDDRITVPSAAFNFESDATVMGLRPGMVVTLRDLLYGLLLPSGADAANTIAIHYAGSEAKFVSLMNREAAVLGMHDTHYVTAHGLTAPNQYTSAYDLAVLGQYVSYIPEMIKITSTRQYRWNGHVLTNINHVLFWYPGIDGLKPGFTDDAGLCQVLDARRDGRHVVVAILNTPDLVIDARDLLNFGLRDFTWIQSALPGDFPGLIQQGRDQWGAYDYLPASGHYLRGRFLSAFLADGGLATLGYPRTEPLGEGPVRVQYFENGALAQDASGHVNRLPLGLTAVPTPTPTPATTPVSSPTPLPSPTATPAEGSFTLTGPGTPMGTPTSTPAITPTATRTRTPRRTPTPTPAPPTPTPTPSHAPLTARLFSAFQRAHSALLGRPVSSLVWSHNYAVQVFAYGALLYDAKSHQVLLLPIGDRLLRARNFLPGHPGNVYPPGFAPAPALKAIGWLD